MNNRRRDCAQDSLLGIIVAECVVNTGYAVVRGIVCAIVGLMLCAHDSSLVPRFISYNIYTSDPPTNYMLFPDGVSAFPDSVSNASPWRHPDLSPDVTRCCLLSIAAR